MEEKDNKTIIKKSNKKLAIIIIIIILLLILAALGFIFVNKDELFKNSAYIPYSQRQNYVIKDFNDDYLKDYLTNKNILVVCWASWCPNCKEDATAINEFIKQNQDIEVIIVAQDPKKSDVENYLKENNRNWFVIFDADKKIREKLDPGKNTIPNAYLVNKEGEVINKYEGKMTYDQLQRFYNGETITNTDTNT